MAEALRERLAMVKRPVLAFSTGGGEDKLGQGFRGIEHAVGSSGDDRALGRAQDGRWETARLRLRQILLMKGAHQR